MDSTQIDSILQLQREYYDNGATIPVSFREKQLKKLYQAVQKYRPQIEEALKKDLGKSSYESFMCEIGLVLSEISYMIRHVKKFSKRKRLLLRLLIAECWLSSKIMSLPDTLVSQR